ncbi:MAG: sugar nucleotide-binding protein [Faecalibacterium sp.]
MKILISGSSGFVGSRVLHQWQGRAELFTFPRGSLAAADESAIRRFAETVQPDVILHLAALSDTGYCQQHPEESQRANVELPVWMAKAARDTGAKLISFSSDQVYAGVTQPGPLPETLPLSPANTYGQHKLEAEERVLALCPEAVLLRAPWMYDLPGDGLPLRGNLPLNLLQAAQNGTPVRFSPHDSPGCQLGAGSGGTALPRLAAARRCIQFWQRERCRHGHNGPAVCRSAGRAGADRAC